MDLFRYKPIGMGFSVLCPDRNPSSLESTVKAIHGRYPDVPIVASVPADTNKQDIAAMLAECPVIKGLDTITSLINAGMNASKGDWTVTIMAGSYVRNNIDKKYSLFIEAESDILFPIIDGRTNFVDGTLNGIMIHRTTWGTVGEFCNKSPLGICKLGWAITAIEKKCTFKAIMGARIC